MRGEGETQSGAPPRFSRPPHRTTPPATPPDFGLAYRGSDPAHEEREGPLTPGDQAWVRKAGLEEPEGAAEWPQAWGGHDCRSFTAETETQNGKGPAAATWRVESGVGCSWVETQTRESRRWGKALSCPLSASDLGHPGPAPSLSPVPG